MLNITNAEYAICSWLLSLINIIDAFLRVGYWIVTFCQKKSSSDAFLSMAKFFKNLNFIMNLKTLSLETNHQKKCVVCFLTLILQLNIQFGNCLRYRTRSCEHFGLKWLRCHHLSEYDLSSCNKLYIQKLSMIQKKYYIKK